MGRATNLLIITASVVSAYFWISGIDLTFSKEALLAGNYLSLITALFAHASLVHLAGNMAFLYVFGGRVERDLGQAKLLLAFFFGGIASFLLSVPFYPDSKMLGASAAIFTLAALAMLAEPLSFSIIFLMPIGAAALMYFIYNVIAIFQGVVSNTAYISHIIGFVAGIALGKFWVYDWKKSLIVAIITLILYALLVNVIAGLLLE